MKKKCKIMKSYKKIRNRCLLKTNCMEFMIIVVMVCVNIITYNDVSHNFQFLSRFLYITYFVRINESITSFARDSKWGSLNDLAVDGTLNTTNLN